MSNKKHNPHEGGFGRRPDIMDRIGESLKSIFSRKARKADKDDDLLIEFSSYGDDYELFEDETKRRAELEKKQKIQRKIDKNNRVKKPVTPFVRKVKNIVTYCSIVAVVLILCVILSLTVLFKTQSFEVTGNTKYTKEEIVATSGIKLKDNIFLANKKAAKEKLIATYAYIEDVKVSFSIPDKITIEITEAVPAYIVKVTDSEYLVASKNGRILEQTDDIDKYNLPLFIGNDLTTDVVGGYIAFANETTLNIINEIITVFTDNGYKGITEIDATDTSDVTFSYDDRIKVKIGLPEDISYKVRTAMTIIVEKLDLNGTNSTEGELDVSSCNTTKKSYFREQSLIDSQAPNNFDDYEFDDDEPEKETEPPNPDDWYL